MERGVAAAGEGFPSHQFWSIVHQGGAGVRLGLDPRPAGMVPSRKRAQASVVFIAVGVHISMLFAFFV